MMQDFIVYDRETGRIERTGQCSTITDCLLQNGGDPTLGVALSPCNEATDYVVAQQVTPRPAFPVDDVYALPADGETVLVIPLPVGTLIALDGGPSEALTDADLEIVADTPTTYRLGLSLWPYLDRSITVNAHAPDTH